MIAIPTPRRPHGFTLLEILIVVVVIAVLVAILVPSISKLKKNVAKSTTIATLGALQTGIQQYYADFGIYPYSQPTTYASGVLLNRGANMLAEGLMGYLDYFDDGAGPAQPGHPDPQFGFRTLRNLNMGGGRIFGPYASSDPQSYKVGYVGNTDVHNPTDQYFVDSWSAEIRDPMKHYFSHEILYYRSTRSGPGAPTTPVTQIFGTGPDNNYFFDTNDNAQAVDSTASPIRLIPSPLMASPRFFSLLSAGSSNTVSGIVTGSDSYILISAGVDGVFFTADDIVVSKN
jgi:prepilin-type N-terminal cleavage/methylation domain-containing protein